MPDRLVDLEGDLLAVQDDRARALRALRRAEQRDRLLGHARRIGEEVEAEDVLPARRRAQPAAVRGRVGAHLQVVAVGRVRGDPRAGGHGLLGTGRALGRREGLALAPGAAAGDRSHEALVAGAQCRLDGEEQLELVLQRDREGVELVRRGPVAGGGSHWREGPGGRRRLRLRDGERAGEGRLRAARGDVAGGGEAPAAADLDADTDALRRRAVDGVDAAAEHGDRLAADVDVARLGVGAAPVRGDHQVGQELEHQNAAS
jgi:hypothetical protein